MKGFLAEMACHLDEISLGLAKASRPLYNHFVSRYPIKVGPHAAIIHRKVRIQCKLA